MRSRWKPEYWALVFSGFMAISTAIGAFISYGRQTEAIVEQKAQIQEIKADIKPLSEQVAEMRGELRTMNMRLSQVESCLMHPGVSR